MWPLTLDLSVCKLIMQEWFSICCAALCFEGESSGWRREGLSPQPTQLNTHEHSLGIIKEALSPELFSPKLACRSWYKSTEKRKMHEQKGKTSSIVLFNSFSLSYVLILLQLFDNYRIPNPVLFITTSHFRYEHCLHSLASFPLYCTFSVNLDLQSTCFMEMQMVPAYCVRL